MISQRNKLIIKYVAIAVCIIAAGFIALSFVMSCELSTNTDNMDYNDCCSAIGGCVGNNCTYGGGGGSREWASTDGEQEVNHDN